MRFTGPPLIGFLSITTVLVQAPPNVTRGPYLQLATPTSVVVRWRTDIPMPAAGAVIDGGGHGPISLAVMNSSNAFFPVPTMGHPCASSSVSKLRRSRRR